jgi:hypothetical protein
VNVDDEKVEIKLEATIDGFGKVSGSKPLKP